MGTGFHGGFGSTTGALKQKAPVSALKDVRYSKKKTEGYLLNPAHPTGSSKAKFMREVLGYKQSDAKKFHKNVISSIIGKQPSKTEETSYGTKLTFQTKLKGINGKQVSANIVVVIQKDKGRKTFKIVTVYPGEKES